MPITPDLKVQFGQVIRARRTQLRISQEVLAERAGLHRTYITDIERGARNPSLASINRLAKALESSIAGLFEHEKPDSPSTAPTTHIPQVADILLVEDNPNDVHMTQRAFEKARLSNHMHVCRDGAEALDWLFSVSPTNERTLLHRPDVVLLDLDLPRVDGLEVLRRIRADERTRSIPVVVLTIKTLDGIMEECRQLGVEQYIVKPVDFQQFSRVTPQLNLAWMLHKPLVTLS